MPNLDWCPRTLQKQHFRKMFVPCWSIWCQTCAGGDFSASQHGDPEPVRNLFFVGRSSHFGPFGATTGMGGDLSASWHGVPQPFKNYFFVGRSSHFGTFSSKLALVVKLRHPSTLSQNHSKTTFSQGVRPILSAKLHPKLKLNVSKNQETNERNLESPIL